MGRDRHREFTDEARVRVEAYVLGGMSQAELVEFEEHLESCGVCRWESSRLHPVATLLVQGAPEVEPPPALRERLMERIGRRPLTLLPAAERHWCDTDVPGAEITQLWLDSERRRHTTLLRMASGVTIPAHRHAGPEECYVVEGDVRDGDLVLGPGDYVLHEPGSEHVITTCRGCLLLLTASLEDSRITAD